MGVRGPEALVVVDTKAERIAVEGAQLLQPPPVEDMVLETGLDLQDAHAVSGNAGDVVEIGVEVGIERRKS